MNKRYRDLLAAGGMAIALTLSGCNAKEAAKTEAEAVKETPVQVGEITKGSLTVQNEVIAKVISDNTVDVMPKMIGELVKVNVKKGDKVNKGAVLAVIDNSDQQLNVEMEKNAAKSSKGQYEQALVQKKQAETAVSNAEIGVKQAELNVQKAKDGQATGINNSGLGLGQAEINLNDAQMNFDRMSDLYEAGAVAKVQLEQAETALNQAKIALEQAKLQESNAVSETDIQLTEQALEQAKVGLANAQLQVELADAGIKQAQVGIDSNDLRIKQAEDKLSDSKITAPISGEITAVNGAAGDVISTSAPFTTIVDLNKIHVEAQVNANQLPLFENGQEIQVEIPSLKERFLAKIVYLANVANDAGFYPLEAVVGEHGGKIKPGMIAKVIHETKVSEESLLVPTNAVIEKGSKAYIFVVKDGKAVQTPVTIIQAQTELTAVSGEGLSEKDTLVIKGQNTLADGNQVRIIEGEN